MITLGLRLLFSSFTPAKKNEPPQRRLLEWVTKIWIDTTGKGEGNGNDKDKNSDLNGMSGADSKNRNGGNGSQVTFDSNASKNGGAGQANGEEKPPDRAGAPPNAGGPGWHHRF